MNDSGVTITGPGERPTPCGWSAWADDIDVDGLRRAIAEAERRMAPPAGLRGQREGFGMSIGPAGVTITGPGTNGAVDSADVERLRAVLAGVPARLCEGDFLALATAALAALICFRDDMLLPPSERVATAALRRARPYAEVIVRVMREGK